MKVAARTTRAGSPTSWVCARRLCVLTIHVSEFAFSLCSFLDFARVFQANQCRLSWLDFRQHFKVALVDAQDLNPQNTLTFTMPSTSCGSFSRPKKYTQELSKRISQSILRGSKTMQTRTKIQMGARNSEMKVSFISNVNSHNSSNNATKYCHSLLRKALTAIDVLNSHPKLHNGGREQSSQDTCILLCGIVR